MIETIVVIAKRPEPGRVKTRLVPPLTHVEAASLASAALSDTLRVVDDTPTVRRVLTFDGPVDGWLPPGWAYHAQPPGGLDSRIVAAFESLDDSPALLVGMDTPQMQPAHLLQFNPQEFDACLGPASDGGYWAIGFRCPYMARRAIAGIPMSSDRTAAKQLERLAGIGLRVQLLPELTDVDTIEDAREVAAHAADTDFASQLNRVTLVPRAS